MEEETFHDYKKNLESVLRRIKESETLTEFNQKTIARFHNAIINEGLSQPRIIRLLEQTFKIATMLNKDFDKANREDIERLVSAIHSNPKWSFYTIMAYKITIKQFYKWFQGDNEEYPAIVKWIKIGKGQRTKALPNELISEQDVEKILSVCANPRDKAIVSLLWESGARVGEIGTTKIKSLTIKDGEAELVIHGKTGWRKILLISSLPYLKTWLQYHPFKDDKDSPLFTMLSGKRNQGQISYRALAKVIRFAMRAAKVDKPTNPHLWRHSRATYLANYLTEAQLCTVLGWVIGSREAGTYVHLSGRETNDKIRQINGVIDKKQEEIKSILTPIKCVICGETNEPQSEICCRCYNPLSIKGAVEKASKSKQFETMFERLDAILNDMKEFKEFKEKFETGLSNAQAKAIFETTKAH